MTVATEADPTGDELVLEPPSPIPSVTQAQAAATIKVDDATAARINSAVAAYIESLTTLQAQSPEFERKVASISRMGRDEIRRSAEASSRFLDRPTAALQQGPMAEGSQVSSALVALRQQVEELDPSRHLQQRRGHPLRAVGSGSTTASAATSRQQHIEATSPACTAAGRCGDNALNRSVHLWRSRRASSARTWRPLRRGAAERLTFETTTPKSARPQGMRCSTCRAPGPADPVVGGGAGLPWIDPARNVELVKGVERATTTTVSALRTAVIAALALGNQKLVLDQVTALNATTGNIIESTSQMLRQQTLEIAGQAANTTISIEKLQAAFNNIYATIDTIDSFKLAALENMRKTIDSLSTEVARAQQYVERTRSAELAQLGHGLGLSSRCRRAAREPRAMWLLLFIPVIPLVLLVVMASTLRGRPGVWRRLVLLNARRLAVLA
jgi:uncharacterized protein YaaN involved in tellurite resistance